MFDFLNKELLVLRENEKFDFVTFRVFDTCAHHHDITYSADYFPEGFLQHGTVAVLQDIGYAKHTDNTNVYLKPDLKTFFPDFSGNSIIIHCNVVVKMNDSGELYKNVVHDPRYIAQRADEYLRDIIKIDEIAFLVEIDFYAHIEDALKDEFYNMIKIHFKKSNIQLVSYIDSDFNKKSLGIFSFGILDTADTIEKAIYLIKKISSYQQIDVIFEDEQKKPARIVINHILYQNKKSIFKLNNFFSPSRLVHRYVGGIFSNYVQLIDLSTVGERNLEKLTKIKFSYAEEVMAFKKNCKLFASDIYISLSFANLNMNYYLMLTSLMMHGLNGVYEKIDLENLDIMQNNFILEQKSETDAKQERSNGLINNIIEEEVIELYRKI